MGSGSELWDWDSLLLQSRDPNPTAAVAAAAAVASDDGDHHHQLHHPQQQRRRWRDPRLTCPNYLAGRVPCACSDEEQQEQEQEQEQEEQQEEEEAERSSSGPGKKRSRLLLPSSASAAPPHPRCQVAECGADLSGFKGYHQRRRVCLGCANASSVVVSNQEQRYCQQCGKFHPLLDFDEDKRSCRRKLAKHNKRRRRGLKEVRLSGDEDMAQAMSTAYNDNMNNTKNSSKAATDTNTNMNNDGNSSTALEAVSTAPPPCVIAASDAADAAVSNTDGFLGLDSADLALLLDDSQPDSITQAHPVVVDDAKHSAYTSPYPTRRISFKFYDWNPADFPRSLREQIFEWLANMPVELEGYIRSGCTILTLYIAMPEAAWCELRNGWEKHLDKLINGVHTTGSGFWNTGFAIAYFDDKISCIDHGLIASLRLPCAMPMPPPVQPALQGASPICIRVGVRTRVTLLGRNLTHARVYSACDGKFIPNCVVGEADMESKRVRVSLFAPHKAGVVLFEVGYEHGISGSFVPVLLADERVCEEVGRLEQEVGRCLSRPQLHDLIVDLGWMLGRSAAVSSSAACHAHKRRLNTLDIFSASRGWVAVRERVARAAGVVASARPATAKVLLLQQPRDMQWPKYAAAARAGGRAVSGRVYKVAMWLLLLLCAAACVLLQHPRLRQQQLHLSASLRRLLWSGSTGAQRPHFLFFL